jgi:hypothetical protein
MTVAGVWGGLVLAFGDQQKWRSAPSLKWLQQAYVPLQWWGWALIIYSLLLTVRKTRAVGFGLGAAIYAVFAVSLIATLGTPGPKSAVAVAGLVDVVALHAYAMKTALAADAAERLGL